MPTLELAENSGVDYFQNIDSSTRTLSESAPEELYIFIPTDYTGNNGMWVREDYFDGLTDDEWERTMEGLADYQPQMMNGIFDRMRENIAARRERRADRKQTRQDTRTTRIEGRSEGLFGGKLRNLVSSFLPDVGGGEIVDQYSGGRGGLDLDIGYQTPTFWDKNKMWLIPLGIVFVAGVGYVVLKKDKDKKK